MTLMYESIFLGYLVIAFIAFWLFYWKMCRDKEASGPLRVCQSMIMAAIWPAVILLCFFVILENLWRDE